MTPAEIESVINAYIIDNNTNQVTPAKVRFVLKTLNNAIQQTDASAVFAILPNLSKIYCQFKPIELKLNTKAGITESKIQEQTSSLVTFVRDLELLQQTGLIQ